MTRDLSSAPQSGVGSEGGTMARLSNVLIALTLFAGLAMPLKPALAETLSGIEALEILAKGEAANAKCKILSEPEQSELSGYAARAEIAAARRITPEEAQSAIRSGTIEGQAATC